MIHQRPTPTHWIGVALALLAALLLAGCGNSGSETPSNPSAPPAGSSPAVDYLKKAQTDLDKVLADYQAGKKDEAHQLAETLGHDYEGVPEEAVAKASPTVNRQLDPLIEATLPQAIDRGASTEEVAELVKKTKELLSQALEAVEKQ